MGEEITPNEQAHEGQCAPPYHHLLMFPEKAWDCLCGRRFKATAVADPVRGVDVYVWLEISKGFTANTVFYRA